MQSWRHPSMAPGTIPAVSLASLPCCQCCQAGHCLLSLCSQLPAAQGQYCSAQRQLPGVTALDQLLTWHKPGRRKVDNVLKGEKKQQEGDSSLAKCPGRDREKVVNLGGSPWGKAPTSCCTARDTACCLLSVPGPERGGERLTFRVCDFLVIRVTNTKYYHFKVDPAFTEKWGM